MEFSLGLGISRGLEFHFRELRLGPAGVFRGLRPPGLEYVRWRDFHGVSFGVWAFRIGV